MSKTFNLKRQDKKINYFTIMQNNFLEEDGYGIPETYPNHNKVIVGSRVVLVGKNKGMRNLLRGYATVKSVEYHDSNNKGKPGVIKHISWNGSYKKLSGTISEVAWQKIKNLPGYNDQLPIRVISKEIFDQIVKEGSQQEVDDEEQVAKESENQRRIFVTGYDERNLDISRERGILGWVNRSNFLSAGGLVFVFNKDSLVLETCFEVKSQYSNNDLIWEDEKTTGKIIYNNRWRAEVLHDNLAIPLQEINSIPPFDTEKFQGLLRGNFPMPLDTPSNYDKYTKFREMLLQKINSNQNYWIFVVTDQGKFSAESIYRTRMNDMFWGLNERTSHRKALKKGDKVIFSQGAKMFLGTAALESDAFRLDDQQENKYSHENDVFKTEYGVLLKDIISWQEPKKVEPYADSLSFISNITQYPVYFQGGVKKISVQDYNLILSGDDPLVITQEFVWEDQPLHMPSVEQLNVAIAKIKDKLLIDDNTIRNIVSSLVAGKHILLAGPIGTGKTHLARMISAYLWSDFDGGYYPELFTATSVWTTQEVIGGIYPKMDDKTVIYETQKGCVSDTVSRNWQYSVGGFKRKKYTDLNGKSYRGVWLIIDEFNRANIDSAFGDMITAFEHGSLKIPTGKKGKYFEELAIPKDYRIIGTLNTFDKHFLFKLSDALKRRFAYIEILPPQPRKAEEEKYYVLKRSLEDLDHIPTLRSKISLINDKREIDRNTTDSDLLQVIDSSYEMFKFIRFTKNLGTAVLISIFRFVLVDSVLNDKLDNSLDNGFKSNIIPQLEGRSRWSLEVIRSFCCEQITEFLKTRNVELTDFGKYQQEFRKLIAYFGKPDVETKLARYRRKEISDNEWNEYDPWIGKRKPWLPLFRKSLIDLIEETEII